MKALGQCNLALFGPPGSGKGTQAGRLRMRFGLEHIATGDMLREEQARGTGLGTMVRSFVEAGKLVPDDVIISLIRQRLQAVPIDRGFVLDGFPRSVAQARSLLDMLDGVDRHLDCCIVLEVPETALLERLRARAGLEHRVDDSPEIVGERLRVFKEQTEPVLEFLADQVQIVRVDGSQSMDTVTTSLVGALG